MLLLASVQSSLTYIFFVEMYIEIFEGKLSLSFPSLHYCNLADAEVLEVDRKCFKLSVDFILCFDWADENKSSVVV